MVGLLFCCKSKAKKTDPSESSRARIHDTPVKKDEAAEAHLEKSWTAENIECIGRSYDAVDTDRGLYSCIKDILGSDRSIGKKLTNSVEIRKCQSDSNLLDQVQALGPEFATESNHLKSDSAAQPEFLRPIGRRVQVTRSLQDYLAEEKQKHLPSSNDVEKNHNNRVSRSRHSQSGSRSGLSGTEKEKKRKDRHEEKSDILNRKASQSYSSFHNQEMDMLKRRSIDDDEWDPLEDILSEGTSNQKYKEPKLERWKHENNRKRKDGNKKITDNEKGKEKTPSENESIESGVKVLCKNESEKRESINNAVIYDEAELELMEDIEREYLSK